MGQKRDKRGTLPTLIIGLTIIFTGCVSSAVALEKGSTQYWVGLGVLWGRLLRGRGRGWEGAREGISIAAATHPPPGHCRHTLHLANIVPDQRMRGRNRKRTAGSKKGGWKGDWVRGGL